MRPWGAAARGRCAALCVSTGAKSPRVRRSLEPNAEPFGGTAATARRCFALPHRRGASPPSRPVPPRQELPRHDRSALWKHEVTAGPTSPPELRKRRSPGAAQAVPGCSGPPHRASLSDRADRPTGTQRPTQRQRRQRSPQRGTDGAGGAEKPNPSGAGAVRVGAVRVGARPPGCGPDSVVAPGLTRSRAAPGQSAHRAERCAPLHHPRGRAGMWHPANSHPSPLRHGNPRRERSAASRSLHVAIWEAFQLLHS